MRKYLLLSVFVLAACSGDVTGPVEIGGAYSMVSFAGNKLPYTYPPPHVSIYLTPVTLRADTLYLDASGSFDVRAMYTIVRGAGISDDTVHYGDLAGTYATHDNAITFTMAEISHIPPFSGEVKRDTLFVTRRDSVFKYVRVH